MLYCFFSGARRLALVVAQWFHSFIAAVEVGTGSELRGHRRVSAVPFLGKREDEIAGLSGSAAIPDIASMYEDHCWEVH